MDSNTNDLPQRLLPSQQKEFKRIKNLIIEAAARLGEYTEVFTPADIQEPSQAGENTVPEPEVDPQSSDAPEVSDEAPPAVVWSERYQRARFLLFGDDDTPQNQEGAYKLFMEEGPPAATPSPCTIWAGCSRTALAWTLTRNRLRRGTPGHSRRSILWSRENGTLTC